MQHDYLADLKNSIDDMTKTFDERAKRWQSKCDKLESKVDDLTKFSNEQAVQLARLEVGGGGFSAGKRDEDDKEYSKAWWMAALRREVNDSDCDRHFEGKYAKDFETMIRLGKSASAEVFATMQVGSQPDGGYLAPVEMQKQVFRRMYEDSEIRQVCRIMPVSAGAIEWPTCVSDDIESGWVDELQERPETLNPKFGMQSIYLREQYAMPSLTQKLVDDAVIPIEPLVTDLITDKMLRTENESFVSGNGVNKPRGFYDYAATSETTDDATREWGKIQHVVSGDASGFPMVSGVPGASDPNALITLVSKLKFAYRRKAKWAMNRQVAGDLRKLKDGEGRYLWRDGLEAGQPDRFLGYEVVYFEHLPNIVSGAYPIWFGDWSRAFLVLDHMAGLRLLRDNLTTKGRIKLYTTKRVGSDIVDFDALKALKIST